MVELQKNPLRDTIFGVITTVIMLGILSIFAVIFVIPFVQEWPYQVSFSLEHVKSVISDPDLLGVYTNSLFVAVMTAIIGVLISYGAKIGYCKKHLKCKIKKCCGGDRASDQYDSWNGSWYRIYAYIYRNKPSKYLYHIDHM